MTSTRGKEAPADAESCDDWLALFGRCLVLSLNLTRNHDLVCSLLRLTPPLCPPYPPPPLRQLAFPRTMPPPLDRDMLKGLKRADLQRICKVRFDHLPRLVHLPTASYRIMASRQTSRRRLSLSSLWILLKPLFVPLPHLHPHPYLGSAHHPPESRLAPPPLPN